MGRADRRGGDEAGRLYQQDNAEYRSRSRQPPGRREDDDAIRSLAIAKGTLWHRGGANLSDRPRLIITPQYCAGWVRQLENMSLAVPAELAKKLPERARELIGYSIHPPFMGHVDGVHPKRLLQAQAM